MVNEPTAGEPGGGGTIKLPNGAQFLIPKYTATPWFPYAGLQDQMMDAQQSWAKGAGQFANNNTPIGAALRGFQPNVGGGLLGRTAYSGGPNPFLAGFQQPAGFNPYAGRALGMGGGAMSPGGGPAGTPTIPGGYAPGSPMQRPGAPVAPGTPGRGGAPLQPPPGSFNPFQQPGARTGLGGIPTPTGAGARSAPAMSGNVPGLNPLGYGGSQGSGGLLAWQNGQQNMSAEEKARLGGVINAQGQYDPSKGGTPTSAELVSIFNSLPEERRGDFINAWDQWSIGKVNNGGAQLQQALRDAMGKSNFDNWYATNVQNKQGSNITSLAGLPSWMQSLR
jgi:hypothetical protein